MLEKHWHQNLKKTPSEVDDKTNRIDPSIPEDSPGIETGADYGDDEDDPF
jgi:hypothetical protein